MKAIFCDVDGVLNNRFTRSRSPNGYTGVSNDLIGNLRKIVVATGAKIILSSDWRLVRDIPVRKRDFRYLVNKLRIVASLDIADYTDDIDWNCRGREIRKYLTDHPDISDYVVLDDLPFKDFEAQGILPHLVLTDPHFGLTMEDVERAVKILQGEEVEPYDPSWF